MLRHLDQMSRRVGAITGLDMSTAEDLQVCNYGIGGHYEPHFDYARVKTITRSYKKKYHISNFVIFKLFVYVFFSAQSKIGFQQKNETIGFNKDSGWRNRIATWLFYVSFNL
jgi:prolyl 4-hydroxylase